MYMCMYIGLVAGGLHLEILLPCAACLLIPAAAAEDEEEDDDDEGGEESTSSCDDRLLELTSGSQKFIAALWNFLPQYSYSGRVCLASISDEEEHNSSLCDEEEDRQGGCTVCRERNSYTKAEEGRRGGRAVAGSPVGSLPVGPCRQWTGSGLQVRVASFLETHAHSLIVHSSNREENLLKANYCCCSLEDGSAAAAAVSPSLPMRMLREPHSQLALMLLSLTPSENST